MPALKLEKFFRVQTASRDSKSGAFVMRHAPGGGEVVTINRKTYMAAKKAAASALSKRIRTE